MPVGNRIEARLQYQTTAEGDAAVAWLDDWTGTNAGPIQGQPSYDLTPMVDDPEGCQVELNLLIHFQTDTTEDFTALRNEVEAALYAGGVAQADCNSVFGAYSE